MDQITGHVTVVGNDRWAAHRWSTDQWAPGTMAGPTQGMRTALAAAWLAFAAANVGLMIVLAGGETVPFHLVWVSFALLYGLLPWPRRSTVVSFVGVTLATGLPLLAHARAGLVEWAECSEIILMAVIVGLLMWHVDRHRGAQRRIGDLLEYERDQAQQRELTARFGSHEVRTRLTVARGLVQMMRKATNDPAMRTDADLVLGEIDKASTTVTTLLHLVRADAPVELATVALDDVVHRVVDRWSAGVERVWASSSTVGSVLGEGERLEAALDCLIENAVRFTGRTDTIRVDAHTDGPQLVLSVSDTGMGIPEGDRERIFQVFETGGPAGEHESTGLGLALVRALVEARGGTLGVSSELGRGSCFTLCVPFLRPAVEPDPRSAAAPDTPAARPLYPPESVTDVPGPTALDHVDVDLRALAPTVGHGRRPEDHPYGRRRPLRVPSAPGGRAPTPERTGV